MVKITVLKVDIDCLKCKKKLIKAVSSLRGIDKIEVDEGKETMTIIGDADPFDIIIQIKKIRKNVKVLSIGPPSVPPPPKQDSPKKPKKDKKPKEKPEKKGQPVEKNKPESMSQNQISNLSPYILMPPQYYCPQYHQAQAHAHAQPVAVLHMTKWDEPDTSCTIM